MTGDGEKNAEPSVSVFSRVRYMLPFVFGVIAVLSGVVLAGFWQVGKATIDKEYLQCAIELIPERAAHFQTRYAFFASFLFFVAAGSAAFFQSCHQIVLSLNGELPFCDSREKHRAVCFVLGIGIAIGVIVFAIVQYCGKPLRSTLVPKAFDLTLGKCAPSGCIQNGCQPQGASYLATLDQAVLVANAMASFGTVFVAVAACCLVYQAQRENSADLQAVRDIFTRLAQRWKNHLYFASLFLVSGIIHMAAWRSWPTAYMSRGADVASAFRAAANGTVMIDGMIYTMMLFAIFFSAAAMMNDEYTAKRLDKAGDTLPLGDFKNLLNMKEITKSGVAILAPALSGVIPLLIELIMNLSK